MDLARIFEQTSLAQDALPRLTKLKKATDGVESIFIKDMLSAMRRGMPESSGKGLGGQMYRDMFDMALSDAIGKTGSLGISKILYKDLAKQVVAQVRADKALSRIDLKE